MATIIITTIENAKFLNEKASLRFREAFLLPTISDYYKGNLRSVNPVSSLVRLALDVQNHSARNSPLQGGLSSINIQINDRRYVDHAIEEWRWILLPDSLASSPNEIEVLSALAQLKAQVSIVRSCLAKSELEEDFYDDPLDMFDSVLDITSVYMPWAETQKRFTKARIQVLKFCEKAIGPIESKVPLESIQEILDTLGELEALSVSKDFPIELQLFLLDQISVCRKALITYKIVGGKALVEAGYLLASSAAMQPSDLEMPDEVKDKLKDVWTKIQSAIEKAGVIKSGIEIAVTIGKALGVAN